MRHPLIPLAVTGCVALLAGCSSATPAPKYRTGETASGSKMTLTVTQVTDPADASAPWGSPQLTDSRFVVVNVTGTAKDAGVVFCTRVHARDDLRRCRGQGLGGLHHEGRQGLLGRHAARSERHRRSDLRGAQRRHLEDAHLHLQR